MAEGTNGASAGELSPLVSKKQIGQRIGVCDRKAAAITSEPWFPQPIVIAPRVLRWRWTEIEEALATRAPRREVLSEPEQLARAREQRAVVQAL